MIIFWLLPIGFDGTFNIPKKAFIDICNHNVNVIIIVALAKRFGRGLWDTMMYFLVIRSRGRVPISDGFIARRIAGPGLAANHFFQVMRQFFIIEGDISLFVFCKPTNIAIAMFHKLQSGNWRWYYIIMHIL